MARLIALELMQISDLSDAQKCGSTYTTLSGLLVLLSFCSLLIHVPMFVLFDVLFAHNLVNLISHHHLGLLKNHIYYYLIT